MFAETEAIIVARLQDKLGPEIHVATLDELERVPEMRQKAPAVWIIYDGYGVRARQDNVPGIAQLRQDWFAVVATKSAKGQGSIAVAKSEASALARRVIEALLGYHLGGGNYLQIADAPGPEYDAGYCHVPLAFSNATTFKGQP